MRLPIASRLEAIPGWSGSSTGAGPDGVPELMRGKWDFKFPAGAIPEGIGQADSVRGVPLVESHKAVLACATRAGSPPRFTRSSRAGVISVRYLSSHGSRVWGAPTSIQRRF